MLLEGDLGFVYRLVAAALVVLFGPVGWLVVRQKWQYTVARKDEIRRLLALASDEAARAEFETAAGYNYVYSYSCPVTAEPQEEKAVSVSGSSPVRQSQYQCEVCFSPTTTRCKQCKAVHYCSGKCQIIHWRQGHKDECHPCNIAYENVDVGVQSCLKEFKQDEVESSNVIGNQGNSLAKPVDSSFGEFTFIKLSRHEVPNGKDGTEVENAIDEKQKDITFMASINSLPVECSPSTVLGEMSLSSGGSSNDSCRYDRQTNCTNMERRKSLSLDEPIVTGFSDGVATSKLNEFKSRCIDLDNQSGSSTSPGWSGTGSEENSFSEPSSPSSGFWEGKIDPIKSKIDAFDKCRDVNMPNSHPSGCFPSAARINVHPVGGLSSDANRNVAGAPHLSTSVPKKSTDASLLSKEAFPYGLKSRIPPLISSKTSNSNDVQNIPTASSSKLIESNCSSSSAYCGRTASRSEKNFSSGDVIRESGLQSSTPDMLNNRVDDTSSISQPVKINEADSRTSKVAGTHVFSSTKKPTVANVQSVKIDRTHGVYACSSQCGCLSQNARIDTNKSARTLDPLRDSNLMRNSSLGSRSDAMGRFKGLFPYDLFVKLYNWNKVELRPCGLINCGNSCYANTVLQCLAFTPPLTAYFLQGLHSKACEKKEWCFTCEFETLVSKAREGHSPLVPIRIVSQLQNIGSHLANGREEDAHEFLRYAIESMQFACLEESEVKEPSPLNEETTLVGLTFGGYLRSKIECTRCGGKSERNERMMDLTVEIGGDIGTLEEAIQQFTRAETLDGENKYQCSRCRSYERAKKKLRVLEAPNVLTVALKRFQADKFGKLNKKIKFPEILNMAPYMSGTSDKSPIYQLYGVVVHLDVMNSTFSGHYVCYIKNNHGRWFKVDDSTVQVVELKKVLTTDAYMLLYARCSPRAPRLIRSSIVPHDTKKARRPTCKSRSHSADGQDISTGTCNDFSFHCTSFQPIQTILEEDCWSQNSSFFSEVGSNSTDSTNTNMESTSTDDNFDQMFSDSGLCWNRSWRNSADSDTSSSSSSPSPLHSRHSPLADFETCCHFAEPAVDRHGFWAGEGRGSLLCCEQCRKLVDSSSCRVPGSNKLGCNYDNVKCSSVSCSRRSTRGVD